MNLVYETDNPTLLSKEIKDWKQLGFNPTIKEKRKIFKGSLTTVYRIWVRQSSIYRCPECGTPINVRFPYHACKGLTKAKTS